jgi:hypothetical protein
LRANSIITSFNRFRTQEPNPTEYEDWRSQLLDEQMHWNIQYQYYLKRKVEVTPAKFNLCYAPTDKCGNYCCVRKLM